NFFSRATPSWSTSVKSFSIATEAPASAISVQDFCAPSFAPGVVKRQQLFDHRLSRLHSAPACMATRSTVMLNRPFQSVSRAVALSGIFESLDRIRKASADLRELTAAGRKYSRHLETFWRKRTTS